MRTLEELEHTIALIEALKDAGGFDGARELFEQFVMDALMYISSRLTGAPIEMKEVYGLSSGEALSYGETKQ